MTTNILITVPRLDLPGGVANYYRVLRKHFDASKEYFEIGARALETSTIAVTKRMLGDFWRFHRTLATGKYSLVHLNPSLGSRSTLRDAIFLLIARAHSVPVVAFFHGWDEEFRQTIERRYLRVFQFAFNKASGIIVLAEDFRKQLISMGIKVPIFRLSTCVDDHIFDASDVTHETPDPSVDILYLSRLDHGKGAVEAVRAFAKLQKETPKVTMNVAGDGPERSRAEALAEELGVKNVHFLGHVDGPEKSELFVNSDIFFFPTFFGEGMPTTVLEAMAHGLPVVTREVGGLKDFFENERMGFITGSSDDDEFARLLSLLVGSQALRQQVRTYNRRYAQENFAASAITRKLNTIYENAVK